MGTDPQAPHDHFPSPSQSKLWCKPKTESPSILQDVLRNSDIFALFIAAIGHDIGHPGLSNAFMASLYCVFPTFRQEC